MSRRVWLSPRLVGSGRSAGIATVRAALLIAYLVTLAAAALAIGSCGDSSQSEARLFVAVHVVERLSDGSTTPASGVEVQYEVFGRIRGPANPPLLYSLANSTDANGLAMASVLIDGGSIDDVNLVFVTATHPDGRSAFRRMKVATDVDLGEWFKRLPSDWSNPAAVAARLCGGAERQRDCEEGITDQKLTAWGAAVSLRLPPRS